MIETRLLTGKDASLWLELRLEGLRLYPGAFLFSEPESKDLPRSQVVRMLEQGGSFGCWQGDNPVGIASLFRERALRARHRASIGGFYVRPSVQGQGAADALLDTILCHAEASGIWQLELYVAANNARAMAFYK